MNSEKLKETLTAHELWLGGDTGGSRANLAGANLRVADLAGANLRAANLQGANLRAADIQGANLQGADLQGADLRGVNLRGADLAGANLRVANLQGADLQGADLAGADLRAFGDMLFLKTLQIDAWAIGYTHDSLQIGCECHPISEWRNWKRRPDWIDSMDVRATEWSQRLLPLVLQLIDTSPAEGAAGTGG